jgi:hypothetical protein
MTNETELRECPFCGREPDIRDCPDRDERYWRVSCLNTACSIAVAVNKRTQAEAIAAWNNRPKPPAAVGDVNKNKPTLADRGISQAIVVIIGVVATLCAAIYYGRGL